MSTEEHPQGYRDKTRKRLLKYTRKAYEMLPKMDKPRILDIGCGTGIPTLELARLSQGELVGIDIDQPALDEFNRRVKSSGLADRIQIINRSLFEIDFPGESFDIIWSEGSIYPIGFKKGLQEWKRFLKPGGYMVVHDEQGNVGEKLEQIPNCGYELLGYFLLSKETWRTEYFAPLEEWVTEAEASQSNDPAIIEELRQAQEELAQFRQYPDRNSSVYFVMRKN